MEYRQFGRTGWQVSGVSFGGWAIGGTWGKERDEDSIKTLHTALDQGINHFDTADIYGDGHSEKLLGQLKKERPGEFYIISKAGRRLDNAVTADLLPISEATMDAIRDLYESRIKPVVHQYW